MFKSVLIKVWDFLFYFSVNLRYFVRKILFHSKIVRNNEIANDFRRNGMVKLKVDGLSDYILSIIEDPNNLNKKNKDFYFMENISCDYGIKGINIDIQSEFLWKYIFTKENYELLKAYYKGGPFYLRNNPYIGISYDKETHGAQNFHVDWGLRQCSIMVNLTDTDSTSTHMEYLLGSNRRYWFKQPDRLSKKFKTIVSKFNDHNPQSKFRTQSQKDTMFIFDAGNGLHRQVSGGKRIILHLNFVDNLAYTGWRYGWKPSKTFKESYWFSEISEKTLNSISESGIPQNFFSLVLRKRKPSFLTPKVYSENFLLKSN